MGDLLISVEKQWSKREGIYLPISGRKSNDIIRPATAVGMAQKVNLVGPYMAIAWSGTQIVARGFLKDLRKRVSQRQNPSRDDLCDDFLATQKEWEPELNSLAGSDVSFTVMIDVGSQGLKWRLSNSKGDATRLRSCLCGGLRHL